MFRKHKLGDSIERKYEQGQYYLDFYLLLSLALLVMVQMALFFKTLKMDFNIKWEFLAHCMVA